MEDGLRGKVDRHHGRTRVELAKRPSKAFCEAGARVAVVESRAETAIPGHNQPKRGSTCPTLNLKVSDSRRSSCVFRLTHSTVEKKWEPTTA